MIKVNSVVKLNMPAITKLDKAAIQALEMTAEAVHTEVVQAQVMPFRTGHLQNDSTFVDTSKSSEGKVSIISSTPYARRLYFHPEYHFSKEENPEAGALWFEEWAAGGKHEDFAAKAFAEIYRRLTGT